MSWLARSIADSLRIDSDDDDGAAVINEDERNRRILQPSSSPPPVSPQPSLIHQEEEEDPSFHGVREDLTELKQTLTRQFWGVASFLAPPAPPSNRNDDGSINDEGEFRPSDRSGVVNVSNYYSDNYQYEEEDNYQQEEEEEEPDNYRDGEEEERVLNAVGVTEEVMAFARNIAMHPETWLDFPIDEEDDLDDFDISAAQKEHAFAVEHLAPRLAALRIELCPAHMSEGYFWKIYFVLLHSRLNKQDAELLSTPQVMAARSLWMKELQIQTKQERDWSARNTPRFRDEFNSSEDEFHPNSHYEARYGRFPHTTSSSYEPTTTDFEIVKHPIVSSEMHTGDNHVIDKPMIETRVNAILCGRSGKEWDQEEEDDEDDWLKDGNSDFGGFDKTIIPVGDEEDISFSDLEEDEDVCMPVKPCMVSQFSETSTDKL